MFEALQEMLVRYAMGDGLCIHGCVFLALGWSLSHEVSCSVPFMIPRGRCAFEKPEKEFFIQYTVFVFGRELCRKIMFRRSLFLEYNLPARVSVSLCLWNLAGIALDYDELDSNWDFSGVSFVTWPWGHIFEHALLKMYRLLHLPRSLLNWFSVLSGPFNSSPQQLPLFVCRIYRCSLLILGGVILQFFLHPGPFLLRAILVPPVSVFLSVQYISVISETSVAHWSSCLS